MRLRDIVYAELPNDTARNKQLARDADTTLSQVQRIVDLKLATGVDVVQRLADALGVRPPDLLTPYYRPPVDPYPPRNDPQAKRQENAIHEPLPGRPKRHRTRP